MRLSSPRQGFTLIEVALAMAILAAGSTACLAMFITGLRWTTQAKINASAPLSAQSVSDTPQVLGLDPRNSGPFEYTKDCEGWINNYYAVRTVTDLITHTDRNGSDTGGYTCTVDVDIFHGGDQNDGELVYSIKRIMFFREP